MGDVTGPGLCPVLDLVVSNVAGVERFIQRRELRIKSHINDGDSNADPAERFSCLILCVFSCL